MFPDLIRDDVFRLETRRLWLRWPGQADAEAIGRLAGKKAVAEMTTRIAHPLSALAVDEFILRTRRENADGAGLTMAITPRARPAALIGVVGIGPEPADGTPRLGYWLGVLMWGQGCATEAARALLDAFFAYTANPELSASARVINAGSQRVLEKCGFALTGSGLQAFPARGGVLPVDLFRLDRRAWQSRTSWSHTGFVQGAGASAMAH